MNSKWEVIRDVTLANAKCDWILSTQSFIGLDCEGIQLGPKGEICLIQVVANGSKVFMFDVSTCPAILVGKLRTVLEHPKILKIAHDCRGDRSNLRAQFGIELQPVFDTQVAYRFIYPSDSAQRIGYNIICRKFQLPMNQLKEKFANIYAVNKQFWKGRPLTAEMQEYAAADVIHLPELYVRMSPKLKPGDKLAFEQLCRDTTIPDGDTIPSRFW